MDDAESIGFYFEKKNAINLYSTPSIKTRANMKINIKSKTIKLLKISI